MFTFKSFVQIGEKLSKSHFSCGQSLGVMTPIFITLKSSMRSISQSQQKDIGKQLSKSHFSFSQKSWIMITSTTNFTKRSMCDLNKNDIDKNPLSLTPFKSVLDKIKMETAKNKYYEMAENLKSKYMEANVYNFCIKLVGILACTFLLYLYMVPLLTFGFLICVCVLLY